MCNDTADLISKAQREIFQSAIKVRDATENFKVAYNDLKTDALKVFVATNVVSANEAGSVLDELGVIEMAQFIMEDVVEGYHPYHDAVIDQVNKSFKTDATIQQKLEERQQRRKAA